MGSEPSRASLASALAPALLCLGQICRLVPPRMDPCGHSDLGCPWRQLCRCSRCKWCIRSELKILKCVQRNTWSLSSCVRFSTSDYLPQVCRESWPGWWSGQGCGALGVALSFLFTSPVGQRRVWACAEAQPVVAPATQVLSAWLPRGVGTGTEASMHSGGREVQAPDLLVSLPRSPGGGRCWLCLRCVGWGLCTPCWMLSRRGQAAWESPVSRVQRGNVGWSPAGLACARCALLITVSDVGCGLCCVRWKEAWTLWVCTRWTAQGSSCSPV